MKPQEEKKIIRIKPSQNQDADMVLTELKMMRKSHLIHHVIFTDSLLHTLGPLITSSYIVEANSQNDI